MAWKIQGSDVCQHTCFWSVKHSQSRSSMFWQGELSFLKCPWLAALFLLMSLICTSRLLLQHRHVIWCLQASYILYLQDALQSARKSWEHGFQEHYREIFPLLFSLRLLWICALLGRTSVGVTGQGRRLLRTACWIKPASKCFAAHRSTLLYFWRSKSPFTSFCMTTGV